MKKPVKLLLILSIVFVIFGAVIFGIGAFMHRNDILNGNHSSSEYEQKQYEYALDGLTSIEVNDVNAAIKIITTTGDKVSVTCYESDKDRYDIRKDADGTLIIERRDERSWIEKIGIWSVTDIFGDNKKTVVEIPSNITLDNVNIETVNGEVNVKDLKLKHSLTAKTQNGEVAIENITAQNDISAETTNGRISIDRIKAKSIEASTVNGEIAFTRLEALESLDFDTVNGKISGSVVGGEGDYRISTDTVLGKCNLKDSDNGTKKLSASTVNGEIEINFEN